jgi:hypothetical protein
MLKPKEIFAHDRYKFYSVDIPIKGLFRKKLELLSKKERTLITSETCHVSEKGATNYSSMHGDYYFVDCKHLTWYFEELLKPKSEIKEITMRTSAPHAIIYPHKDALSNSHRKTCLTWAIAPNYQHFAPTVFYNDKLELIYKHYYTSECFLLDTRIIHSMINNSKERTLLQVTFDCEINELF